jgi:Fic family protein
MPTPPVYRPIEPLPDGYSDIEARAVEAVAEVWRDRQQGLRGSPDLDRLLENIRRRWAIETGIVEQLYDIKRGTTALLVEHGFDQALIKHGETDRPASEVVAVLHDHREAVDAVLDLVAGARPLSAHFIRTLHQIFTRHQDWVDALEPFGRSARVTLEKGAWKTRPNNPTRADGVIHAYCPPALVNDEIETLLALFHRATADGVAPLPLSAWLHHRFTQIHPFQDGNGRVARALAAFVLIRGGLLPIVVDRDDRLAYIRALEAADAGDLTRLVHLWCRLERAELRGVLSLPDAEPPPPGERARESLIREVRRRARFRPIVDTRATTLATVMFANVVRPVMERLRTSLESPDADGSAPFRVFRFSGDSSSTLGHAGGPGAVAKHRGYSLDIGAYHDWDALRVTRFHGRSAEGVDIVLSCHAIANTAGRVVALDGYVNRVGNNMFENSMVVGPSTGVSAPLADEPLIFSATENQEDLQRRCEAWVDSALLVALETLNQSL